MFCYTEDEARKLILKAGSELAEKKLIARTWGNISARVGERTFIITPSGKAYETLRPEDLPLVDADTLEYEGPYKPSSEKALHAGLYSLRPECSFIIHTHQFYASVICAQGESTEFAPCAAYGVSGSKKLMRNVCAAAAAYPEKKAFLMARHGAIAAGSSYDDAFSEIEALENSCSELYRDKVHEPLKGIWLDDYAQMFSLNGKPNKNEEENAVELVKDKNEAAASYVTTARPISCALAFLEHTVYTFKYSKLIGK